MRWNSHVFNIETQINHWYDPDGSYCATNDLDSGPADALAVDGDCGSPCDLANLVPGMDTDFALSSASSTLSSSGAALRLSVLTGGSTTATPAADTQIDLPLDDPRPRPHQP